MPSTRRFVERIMPDKTESFDQQFWPVLVALCVLSGIAFGAILTLLRGPWMWGSLLILPALAALSIYLLYQLDNKLLRRSLQLAIITSLAAHLLVLIFASVTFIFQNDYKLPRKQIAKRPSKVIEVSRRPVPFVWQQTNQQEVPEPKVEITKEQPSVVMKPQPVPVKEQQVKPTPQITKRRTPSQTVPRQGQQLSKLHRQTRNKNLQSTTQAEIAPAAKQQPSKTQNAETKVNVAKTASASQAKKSNDAAKSSASMSNQSTVAKRATQPRPERVARKLEPTMRSTARIRKSRPLIPTAKPNKTLPEVATKKPTQNRRDENSPSQSANQITRRPNTQTISRPSAKNQVNPQRSNRSQVAKAAQRRQQQTDPGISRPESTVQRPRRSTINAPSVSSTAVAESPGRTPDSNQQTRMLNAKTLSVSKGENGVAGKGVGRNLDRDLGGAPSPAVRASDSASRRQTESVSNAEMLTSSKKSDARRSVAKSRTPTFAFKSNTNLAAKIAGSKSPSKQTMEAAATTVDAASSQHRGEVTAQKGTASVDIGPTKVVAEQTASRRSGGGQTEVARLNPDMTRRSSSRSNERSPTLATNAVGPTAAPNTADSAPSSSDEPQPNVEAVAHSRTGGEAALTRDQSVAVEAGDPLNQGSSRLTEQLADSRQRANNDQPLDSGQASEEDEEEMTGNRDTRLAQAPRIGNETLLGESSPSTGKRESPIENQDESVAATVLERARRNLGGFAYYRRCSPIAGCRVSHAANRPR